MLFNSYSFILFFLPVTLLLFYGIGARGHHRIAIAWLVGCSLFFYAWWNPAYLGLLLGSMLFNYAIGVSLGNTPHRGLLALGVTANLLLLGWYKYADFFISNVNGLFATTLPMLHMVLPLAISFFTFQQIAYLIDAYRGETREYNFLHYCLFVTFFPQLIAGPIVHHRQILPQFSRDEIYRLSSSTLSLGVTLFILGLAKKVLLADSLAPYATEGFNAVASGLQLTFFEAWRAALAYSLQLYFDFSGYSDMAIGLAYMFGITLPMNFDSPYRAVNIIDFWRRWHITLSTFLRDYIYIPLGGNRHGQVRRYLNLLTTMLLGGLWHGAAWTFVIWGGLHGLMLSLNHGWHALQRRLGWEPTATTTFGTWMARSLTFIAITFAWVVFRADDMQVAGSMWQGMVGVHGIAWPNGGMGETGRQLLAALGWRVAELNHFTGSKDLLIIALLLLFIWKSPNSRELLGHHLPVLAGEKRIDAVRLQWQPSLSWAIAIAVLGIVSVLKLSSLSEFLYFRF